MNRRDFIKSLLAIIPLVNVTNRVRNDDLGQIIESAKPGETIYLNAFTYTSSMPINLKTPIKLVGKS